MLSMLSYVYIRYCVLDELHISYSSDSIIVLILLVSLRQVSLYLPFSVNKDSHIEVHH